MANKRLLRHKYDISNEVFVIQTTNIFSQLFKLRIKFSYELHCSIRLQFSLKKKNHGYVFNLIVGLYFFYILNICQILCQLDIIYYSIHKIIFYA